MGTNEPTVISGETNVLVAQMLARRSALALEIKGFKRSGRSVLTVLKEQEIDLNDGRGWRPVVTSRTAIGAYKELNALIVQMLGESFDRPLAD